MVRMKTRKIILDLRPRFHLGHRKIAVNALVGARKTAATATAAKTKALKEALGEAVAAPTQAVEMAEATEAVEMAALTDVLTEAVELAEASEELAKASEELAEAAEMAAAEAEAMTVAMMPGLLREVRNRTQSHVYRLSIFSHLFSAFPSCLLHNVSPSNPCFCRSTYKSTTLFFSFSDNTYLIQYNFSVIQKNDFRNSHKWTSLGLCILSFQIATLWQKKLIG